MTNERYQGWTNHATWCVNLHHTNTQGWQDHRNELARTVCIDAAVCSQVRENIWTVEEARRYLLADAFKEWTESLLLDDLDSARPSDARLFQIDMLRGCLADVYWHELADAALESLAENQPA